MSNLSGTEVFDTIQRGLIIASQITGFNSFDAINPNLVTEEDKREVEMWGYLYNLALALEITQSQRSGVVEDE